MQQGGPRDRHEERRVLVQPVVPDFWRRDLLPFGWPGTIPTEIFLFRIFDEIWSLESGKLCLILQEFFALSFSHSEQIDFRSGSVPWRRTISQSWLRMMTSSPSFSSKILKFDFRRNWRMEDRSGLRSRPSQSLRWPRKIKAIWYWPETELGVT